MSGTGQILAHLGTEPIGEGLGQFIAPHGIALDSRGDIYVAEVANTYWPILFGIGLVFLMGSNRRPGLGADQAQTSPTCTPHFWDRAVVSASRFAGEA